MAETVYKAKKPFKQDGKGYYPITTHDQIIMPDGNRWDGQHLSSDVRDEAMEVGSLKVNADQLGGVDAANYALKSDLDFVGLKSDEREGSAGEIIEEVPINANQLDGKTLSEIILKIYPIGSIYVSIIETSPASLFGGTWEQIEDTFLLAASGIGAETQTYIAGTTGGSTEHTLPLDTGSGYAKIYMSGADKKMYSTFRTVPAWDASRTLTISSNASTTTDRTYGSPLGGDTGSGDTMPPYLAVYMWKRVN